MKHKSHASASALCLTMHKEKTKKPNEVNKSDEERKMQEETRNTSVSAYKINIQVINQDILTLFDSPLRVNMLLYEPFIIVTVRWVIIILNTNLFFYCVLIHKRSLLHPV